MNTTAYSHDYGIQHSILWLQLCFSFPALAYLCVCDFACSTSFTTVVPFGLFLHDILVIYLVGIWVNCKFFFSPSLRWFAECFGPHSFCWSASWPVGQWPVLRASLKSLSNALRGSTRTKSSGECRKIMPCSLRGREGIHQWPVCEQGKS